MGEKKKRKKKSKKKKSKEVVLKSSHWKKWIVAAVMIVIFIIFVSRSINTEDGSPGDSESNYWKVIGGVLSFTDIEDVEYETAVEDEGEWYTIYNITFWSRGKDIYARAYVPKGGGIGKGIVTLHAAGARKEHHDKLDKKLLSMGYYVITIDQRGHGMTRGDSPTWQQDYETFMAGGEPIIFLYVYDALLAADVLRDLGAEDIAYLGESMGGRFAITAAALDNNSSGVLVFSTGGIETNEERTPFIDSIDPNTYIGMISPRKVVIYHAAADDVIPIWFAEKSYTLAKDPKKFVPMRGTCQHGYCDLMDEFMFDDLAWIFQE